MPDRRAFPSDLPAPPPAGASLAVWRAALRSLPVEVRVALAPSFSPSELELARTWERDAALARLVEGYPGSIRARAEYARTALSRYAASTWRVDQNRPQPRDNRNVDAWIFLRHNGGNVLSISRLRAILGQK